MDEAQTEFTAAGLDVPHYLTFGNHDALVQGNAAANAAYEAVATGCVKPLTPFVADPGSFGDAFEDIAGLDLAAIQSLLTTDPTKIMLVPPDPNRQFVSKLQYKEIFRAGTQADGHGFDFVDPAEETASGGSAGYYAWNPQPGIRFISVDTVSEAGVIGPSADGNVDDPQFQWLTGQLDEAEAADELVVLFSHHAIPSLTASVPDELAPPCLGVDDTHGHDTNPGCDLDPRDSSPIHLADDLTALLHDHPHVIAWVAGHSHQNTIDPYPNPSGNGGFWSIRVAAEADWPQQSRLSRSSTTRTAPSRSSARSWTTHRLRPLRRTGPTPRRSMRSASPRSAARSPTTTRSTAANRATPPARGTAAIATSSSSSPTRAAAVQFGSTEPRVPT